MKNRKPLIASMAVALLMTAVTSPHIAIAQSSALKRTNLQRHDLHIPGFEVLQAAIELMPGVVSDRHSHPGEEIIYVLEGSIEYTLKGKPPVTLKAGSVLFIPAETVHCARNVGSGKAVELATYVVDKKRPLITIAR